jgi:hypothetical protein
MAAYQFFLYEARVASLGETNLRITWKATKNVLRYKLLPDDRSEASFRNALYIKHTSQSRQSSIQYRRTRSRHETEHFVSL